MYRRGGAGLSPQAVDFDALWAGLKDGVSKIVRLQGVQGMPMMEDVYKLCTAQPQPLSERLYRSLRAFVQQHVEGLAEELREEDGDVLKAYASRWRTYSKGMAFVHQIFRYLNANWISKTLDAGRAKLGALYRSSVASDASRAKDVHEVFNLALVLWRQVVFEGVRERLVRELLASVRRHRDGEKVDLRLLADVVVSTVHMGSVDKSNVLGVYSACVEDHYVVALSEYYGAESLRFMDVNGVSAYMQKAEARIREEDELCRALLDASSYDRVRKAVDAALIENHKRALQVECRNCLVRAAALGGDKQHADLSDLVRMYALLSRLPDGVDPMLEVLSSFVMEHGCERLAQAGLVGRKGPTSDPRPLVDALLEVHAFFYLVVERAFCADVVFVQTLDRALRKLVNHMTNAPELLARHADLLLKRGKSKLEGEALEAKLAALIVVFRYLDDRDIFQRFYSKLLARRLIHGLSVSDEAEANVLSGLKQACGFEYTSKLQRMFQDMRVCEELNAAFKGEGLPVAFEVLVLTQGSWPLAGEKTPFAPVDEMIACQERFGAYYDSIHQGRKLVWLHHLGKVELRITYLKKRYTVQASDYQCAILVHFNECERATFEELLASTNLTEDALRKNVASLVSTKLLKKGKGDDEGSYVLNTRYKNKHLKFKVATAVQKKEQRSGAEQKETYKQVEEDRKLYLQALVVRVMKSRRQLSHNDLIQEVIAQATQRFQPSIPLIKRSIEALIEKEYLERTSEQQYAYLA